MLVKSDGEYTYFATDIAYHIEKLNRGFQLLVNVWGADHHGYLPRLRAALNALGENGEVLRVVFIQMVNLLRAGKPVQMSKRKGDFVTLQELMDEIGVDAARFFYLTRRSDNHLDVDLEEAKRKSSDNPVYYTQYAHARICSIEHEARKRRLSPEPSLLDIHNINTDGTVFPEDGEERKLILTALKFPEVVEDAAFFLEPHRITYYLIELAKTFHGYYNRHRVLLENDLLRTWRLTLVKLIKHVLRNGLYLLGVEAPERM